MHRTGPSSQTGHQECRACRLCSNCCAREPTCNPTSAAAASFSFPMPLPFQLPANSNTFPVRSIVFFVRNSLLKVLLGSWHVQSEPINCFRRLHCQSIALEERVSCLLSSTPPEPKGTVYHWISHATFNVFCQVISKNSTICCWSLGAEIEGQSWIVWVPLQSQHGMWQCTIHLVASNSPRWFFAISLFCH